MKMNIKYLILACLIALDMLPGFCSGTVNFEMLEELVTNRLVCVAHSEMEPHIRNYIKRQTGATDSDIVDCLGKYIKDQLGVGPGTVQYGSYRRALKQFAKLADDKQIDVLAGIAEHNSTRAACDAMFQYYKRTRTTRGIELAERLLNDESIGTNMCGEISMMLRMDAAGAFGEDNKQRSALVALARRQLKRKIHLKLADTLLLRLDEGYVQSEERRLLVEEVLSGRIKSEIEDLKKHFRDVRRSMDRLRNGRDD